MTEALNDGDDEDERQDDACGNKPWDAGVIGTSSPLQDAPGHDWATLSDPSHSRSIAALLEVPLPKRSEIPAFRPKRLLRGAPDGLSLTTTLALRAAFDT